MGNSTILDKLTKEVMMDEYEDICFDGEYKMTEDTWICDAKKAIEKLIPWIYEKINESSDRYIRMRISDLKKDMGKTFEDMYDAEFYWRLKPILFDLDIVIGSAILKDGTEAISMRMGTEKDAVPMTGNIWICDTKKSSDKEKEDLENRKAMYLDYLSEEERKEWFERQKFWEERVKKYDGGTIIATKSIDVDEGFSETKDIYIFTAVLKNGKIGIFLDDESYEEWLFCDFLRNEYELYLFFDSIDVNRMERIYVGFMTNEIVNDIERDIWFSYGMWSPSDDDMDIIGDESFNDRDELIDAFASVE